MTYNTFKHLALITILVISLQFATTSADSLTTHTGNNHNKEKHFLEWQKYRASPKLTGPLKLTHPDDPILNQLDDALTKISTVYMQALFSGTHTPELDSRMRAMEIELFDLLDSLYKQHRLSDYMKYESEVTRQMILYNMLKKLFGYTSEENEKVE